MLFVCDNDSSIVALLKNPLQHRPNRSDLRAWDLSQLSISRGVPFDEGFTAQINLPLERLPRPALQSFSNKVPVALLCLGSVLCRIAQACRCRIATPSWSRHQGQASAWPFCFGKRAENSLPGSFVFAKFTRHGETVSGLRQFDLQRSPRRAARDHTSPSGIGLYTSRYGTVPCCE